jgi:hypothetical protein
MAHKINALVLMVALSSVSGNRYAVSTVHGTVPLSASKVVV